MKFWNTRFNRMISSHQLVEWFSNLFGGNKDLGILGETKDEYVRK